MIINRGAAEVDNHVSRDDIFDYQTLEILYLFCYTNIIPLFSIGFPLIMRREVPRIAQSIFATNGLNNTFHKMVVFVNSFSA